MIVKIILTIQMKNGKNQLKTELISFNCSTSGKSVVKENLTCYFETLNQRKFLIVKISFLKNIYNLYGNFSIQHKTEKEKNYRTLMSTKNNACGYLNGTDKSPVGNFIVKQVSSSIPSGLIHPCPYFGDLNLNVTPKSLDKSMFQLRGLYLVTLTLHNDEDLKVLEFKADGKLL